MERCCLGRIFSITLLHVLVSRKHSTQNLRHQILSLGLILQSMNGENWLLVIDEPVEFEE